MFSQQESSLSASSLYRSVAAALLVGCLPFTLASAPANGSMASCAASMDGELPAYLPSTFHFSGNIRKYYIAAEEGVWDYAPTGWDNWLGVPLNASPRAYAAGYTTPESFGTKWTKARYIGYTDANFTTKTQQSEARGIQGPLMRAEVGDIVEILVSNKLSKNYVSLHSMGLGYNKDNEGSLYPNNTYPGQESVISKGDAIPPGGCFTYKWFVPDASAPTAPNVSKFWAYHSYINMPTELNSGLMGPFIVYARGKMNSTMSSNRELVILYNNFNEANSLLSEINDRNLSNGTSGSRPKGPVPMEGQGYGNYSVWHPQVTNMPGTILTAKQAPSFHSLNGFVFANMPSFEMCVGDSVIWYLYAFGAASHVFHLHGNNFLTATGEEMAGHAIADGDMSVLKMSASTRGKWDIICHVNNHLADGMVADYIVYPRDQCMLTPLTNSSSSAHEDVV